MSLDVWTKSSGYVLDTIGTTSYVTITLPIQNAEDVTFALISGKLPDGLQLVDSDIVGIPFAITQPTVCQFCIRASNGTEFSDRTYIINLEGVSPPVFNTHSGGLPVGINNTYFVFEGSYIEFQIDAVHTANDDKDLIFTAPSNALPPGLVLSSTGLLYGRVQPNQPGMKRQDYQFNILVTGYQQTVRQFSITVLNPSFMVSDNDDYSVDSTLLTADCVAVTPIEWITPAFLGYYVYDNYLTLQFKAYSDSDITYSIDDSPTLPPGTAYNSEVNIISGYIPQLPENRRTYAFSIIASRTRDNSAEVLENKRDFFIDVVEKSNGIIKWKTASLLGTIDVETPSLFSIVAEGPTPNSTMTYTLFSGMLPPGLVLNLDGTIEGKVSSDTDLFTSFDNLETVFDNYTTTFDRTFTFVAKATDQIKDTITNIGIEEGDRYGVGVKEFTIYVTQQPVGTSVNYTNIIVQPLLDKGHRDLWRSFINNHNIFNRDYLYRADDSAFGVQIHLEMMVYAGVEAVKAEQLLHSTLLNHKKKRFQFGELSTAIARNPSTNAVQYEVVYVNMIDPLEEPGAILPIKYQGLNPADDTTPFSWTSMTRIFGDNPPGSTDKSYYPSSYTLWRTRLNHTESTTNGTVTTNTNFLPLWMKTFQPSLNNFIGYRPVIPLCFCKVGFSSTILDKIQMYMQTTGFSLNMIDYTVDRYTVELVVDDISPRYFIFRNEPNTI